MVNPQLLRRCGRRLGPTFDPAFKSLRQGAAGGPVEQLYRVQDRDPAPARDLGHATDVAGGNGVGRRAFDVRHLAVAQPAGVLRLQQVVGPGRASAKVAFGDLADLEAGRGQELLGRRGHLLTMLERAGRMVGHRQPRGGPRCRQPELDHELRNILG